LSSVRIITNVESLDILTLDKGLGDILMFTIFNMSLTRLLQVAGYFHISTYLDWSSISD